MEAKNQVQETQKPRKCWNTFKNFLLLVTIPLSFAGLFHLFPKMNAVRQEIQAGTAWSDITKKYNEGGLEALGSMLNEAPEMSAGPVILKMAREDEKLQEDLRAHVLRLSRTGKISQGEARFFIERLDNLKAPR